MPCSGSRPRPPGLSPAPGLSPPSGGEPLRCVTLHVRNGRSRWRGGAVRDLTLAPLQLRQRPRRERRRPLQSRVRQRRRILAHDRGTRARDPLLGRLVQHGQAPLEHRIPHPGSVRARLLAAADIGNTNRLGNPGRFTPHWKQKSPPERAFRRSGRRDSNSGPLVPQTSALTRLRHAPRPRHRTVPADFGRRLSHAHAVVPTRMLRSRAGVGGLPHVRVIVTVLMI